jgi:hypothetical protein
MDHLTMPPSLLARADEVIRIKAGRVLGRSNRLKLE